MHDLNTALEECRKTLDSLGIRYAQNSEIIIDSRLKRCWGSCRKRKDGGYVIKISALLMEEDVPLDSLKDTLYHELLHTAPGAMSHRKTWLQLAQRVSRATGLNIKPSTSASDKGVFRDYLHDPSVKFLCECEGCGVQIVRYRNCPLARRPDRYHCGSCGGKFKVIINKVEGGVF